MRKIFRETNISNPLIRTRTCVYQGVRNVSFSENFVYIPNGWPLSIYFWYEKATLKSKFYIVSYYTFVLDQILRKKTKVMEIARYTNGILLWWFCSSNFRFFCFLIWSVLCKTCVIKIAKKITQLPWPYFLIDLFPWFLLIIYSIFQTVFIFSKSIVETPEQWWKSAKS